MNLADLEANVQVYNDEALLEGTRRDMFDAVKCLVDHDADARVNDEEPIIIAVNGHFVSVFNYLCMSIDPE